jgi:MerR family transcriptional regulator, light-induced transcriptional regulator
VGNYSIKDLETLSGIKAHTLRIWEQRYHIIQPKRTDTNIRFYGDEELKLILNISLLNQNGYKISKIAEMSPEDIALNVMSLSSEPNKFPEQVNMLVMAMMDLDEDRFERIVSRCILQFGLERMMVNVIYPFLNKVGLLWQIGTINPYQEHFISNLIRQKLIVAIDGQLENQRKDAHKFLLYLPENEMHEIGLLFATYLLKSRGHKVYYLGQSLPMEDLKQACKLCEPDYTFSVVTTLNPMDVASVANELADNFPNITHLLSGFQVTSVAQIKNVVLIHQVHDFITFLDKTALSKA